MSPTTDEIFGLTDHETKRIINAYLEGMKRACTKQEIKQAVDELQRWKIDKIMFDAVINGAANLTSDETGEYAIVHNPNSNRADLHEEFLDGPE